MASAGPNFSLLACLLCLVITSSVSVPTSSLPSTSQGHKVSLQLYYESLCPYCSNFIVNHLMNVFANGLIPIVDLVLVPYGNARVGPNDSITCQHGPAECLLNTIEACAINVWPKLSVHFPFIYCVESLVYDHKLSEWESCFEKLGLDSKPIEDCYASGYGKELELKYAEETNSLQPPHQYVPWVVVNGKPLYEDYENFITYVCEAYNGTSVPTACTELSLITMKRGRPEHFLPVCYNEEKVKPYHSLQE